MIVLGIILLVLSNLLPTFVPVPWNVDNALYVIGWLLLVLGIILAVLSFLGHPIGPGIGRERAGRRWYY